MIIEPKIRGFICTTAHPVGCNENIRRQIDFAIKNPLENGPKRVLIIGGSAGYGLSSRVVTAFAGGASTLSVAFERKASDKKTATAGWYNNYYFEQSAQERGVYAESINSDAFSRQTKQAVAEKIRKDLGEIDLLVYSLAAPKRFDETSGKWISSVLKPIDKSVQGKTVDTGSLKLLDYSVEPATPEEIENTVYVMGGSDWQDWVNYLKNENVLSQQFKTVSFSYLGGELTRAVYRDATIGRAKENLESNAREVNTLLSDIGGEASVAVLKAIVTQSSSAIPSFSLYISLLYQVMKEHGIHENCIEQVDRLMRTGLYGQGCIKDKDYRYRLDELELREDVQAEVQRRWELLTEETLSELADLRGYQDDFHNLFGFSCEKVDYSIPVSPLIV